MRAGCWEAAHLTRLRSVPGGPRGLRTRNVFSATLHPASAGPRHPDQELARTAARTARPSVQLPRLRRPSRRHHAFHTGARRWNRGHSRDLAKSTNSKRMGLEGRLSPTFPREQNPELYSSTLYGKDVRPAEANHRSIWWIYTGMECAYSWHFFIFSLGSCRVVKQSFVLLNPNDFYSNECTSVCPHLNHTFFITLQPGFEPSDAFLRSTSEPYSTL